MCHPMSYKSHAYWVVSAAMTEPFSKYVRHKEKAWFVVMFEFDESILTIYLYELESFCSCLDCVVLFIYFDFEG